MVSPPQVEDCQMRRTKYGGPSPDPLRETSCQLGTSHLRHYNMILNLCFSLALSDFGVNRSLVYTNKLFSTEESFCQFYSYEF